MCRLVSDFIFLPARFFLFPFPAGKLSPLIFQCPSALGHSFVFLFVSLKREACWNSLSSLFPARFPLPLRDPSSFLLLLFLFRIRPFPLRALTHLFPFPSSSLGMKPENIANWPLQLELFRGPVSKKPPFQWGNLGIFSLYVVLYYERV